MFKTLQASLWGTYPIAAIGFYRSPAFFSQPMVNLPDIWSDRHPWKLTCFAASPKNHLINWTLENHLNHPWLHDFCFQTPFLIAPPPGCIRSLQPGILHARLLVVRDFSKAHTLSCRAVDPSWFVPAEDSSSCQHHCKWSKVPSFKNLKKLSKNKVPKDQLKESH